MKKVNYTNQRRVLIVDDVAVHRLMITQPFKAQDLYDKLTAAYDKRNPN